MRQQRLLYKAIAAAIKRNAGTGDGIDAVIIDKNGYRELSRQFIGLTLNE
jgi:proteasome beta subunit